MDCSINPLLAPALRSSSPSRPLSSMAARMNSSLEM
jgi:hypothetical protein